MTGTFDDPHAAKQASRADIAAGARAHYDEVSTKALDWMTTIPRCIDAWEREPTLVEERDSWRRVAERLEAEKVATEAALALAKRELELERRLEPIAEQLTQNEVERQLRAALALQAQPWQPIETAPKDGRTIFVANALFVGTTNYFQDGRWFTWHPPLSGERRNSDPTHWMPLPSLPSAATPVTKP